MEILTLLPILLKVLPFAACGVLYILWRLAAFNRDKAREEAAAAKGSYELAGEVKEIEKDEQEAVAEVDSMDVNAVVDALRGVLRGPSKD